MINELYNIYTVLQYREQAQIVLQEEVKRQEEILIKQEEAILAYQKAYNSRTRTSDNKTLKCGVSNCFWVEISIDYYDLTHPSNISEDELREVLSIIEYSNLPQLAEYFIEAENKFGVNAIFLASLASLESFYGNSEKAQNKNNLFGFGSNDYDDKTYNFSSKREGILYVAEYLRDNYLSEDGKYYNSGSIWDVGSIYCPDIPGQEPKLWAEKIIDIANKYLENLN